MKRAYFLLFFCIVASASYAQELLIDRWLITDGTAVVEPALGSIPNVKGEKHKPIELIKQPLFDFSNQLPSVGESSQGSSLVWREASAGNDSTLSLIIGGQGTRIAFLATYIQAQGFWKGSIGIECSLPFEIYLGNDKLTQRYSAYSDAKGVSKDVTLHNGKHLLLLKVLVSDTLTDVSKLKAYLKPAHGFLSDNVLISVSPKQPKRWRHLFNGTKQAGASLSATGDMVLLTNSEFSTKTERSTFNQRVVRLSDGRQMASFRQGDISQLSWMPKGNKLSYMIGGNIWVYDLDTGVEREVLRGINEISSYTWSPNEQFVIYYVYEKDESAKGDVKQVLSMGDRQPNWRGRNFLYIGNIGSGKHERLTWGNQSTWLQDISPDASNILFSVSTDDFSERPFSKQTMLRLDLLSRNIDTLWTGKPFSLSVSYSPDGKKLLATGAPLAFGNVGVNVSEGSIPNGYDTQAYIYDIATAHVDPITHGFNPSIQAAHWCPLTSNIYFTTVDQDRNTVYEYNVRKRSFTPLRLAEEVVNSISFAKTKSFAVYTGSGTNSWPKAYSFDFKTQKSSIIDNPDAATYFNVTFGATYDWEFISSRGQKVTARYYLPPSFDPNKRYPTIVYYYGGTTPVGRDFGGRYPKELYAAHDFVVLVLQPSGTIGFGQQFSAAHVNAWGQVTADEIIEGTKLFAEQHQFVDAKKIGCMGASYGGFMTQYLLTQTDIFAAAISHAGISSISSYWGEGFWGYAYSAEASANSFPWNNRQLYVDQSPLFNAHKIVTPLLLLHGSDDTNVPVGESIQMYTALKLLGKPVELIQFAGEDHFIVKYSRRLEWTNTILAYFSKHLKGDDNWWKEMYPDKNY